MLAEARNNTFWLYAHFGVRAHIIIGGLLIMACNVQLFNEIMSVATR